MASSYMTPGVYIEEKNAFPGTAVAVETAVPVFIGYTEIAIKDGKSLVNVPTRISSFAEYDVLFGGGFNPKYTLTDVTPGAVPATTPIAKPDASADAKPDASADAKPDASADAKPDASADAKPDAPVDAKPDASADAKPDTGEVVKADAASSIKPDAIPAPPSGSKTASPPPGSFKIGNKYYTVALKATQSNYYLYNSMQLFYANGGSECYILSVGTYGGLPDGIPSTSRAKTDFTNTIPLLEKEYEPTLVVMPDAITFGLDCYTSIYTLFLAHCNKVQSRFAIFDLLKEKDATSGLEIPDAFRQNIGINFLNYGAAYYPWLNTTITDMSSVDFQNIDFASVDALATLLNATAAATDPADKNTYNIIAQSKKDYTDITQIKVGDTPLIAGATALTADQITSINKNFHQSLYAASPSYKAILKEIVTQMNVLPPSAAMAGIYTMVDATRGVWKSPANYSLTMVNEPTINVTAEQQQSLNVDVMAGKSINVIRPFPGIGTLIWGARTLDGNSQDWKYINVRRTMIMIEQSLKLSTRAYVFEPNNGTTWSAINTMFTNFLLNLWKQGALFGTTPEQAFSIQIGLGITMTADDILNGLLKITVKLCIVRPAEFIVLTFQQQQQQA